ncbi:MAG: DUF4366 domain-containing protein [Lachnospiraceae bacterium]|nr:DUF4366 domain-containing protein [Lachnospiraceae bacterium]
MKKKLSIRATISLLLSMILFCMPVGAFLANSGNAVDIQAQEEQNSNTKEQSNRIREKSTTKKESSTEKSTTETTGNDNSETKSGRDSETSSESEDSKPECICKELCSQYSTDTECEVCREDYTHCKYVNPSVKITITTPEGWYKDTVKVSVSVEDVALSGNFTIQSIQAKIGQNGNWTDITEDRYVEISENSSIYVLVTDQKGKTYERNRFVKCFDFDKPTLNAAVSDGLLSIQAHDTDSGIKAVYVNGYEFKKITNGVLNIRLQQFDAGYQYFTIQAMDNAGNMSEVYKTANPYYTDPETEDSNESNPAEQLPVDAEATKPSNATAQVTEHTKTDGQGNEIVNSNAGNEKGDADKESDTKTDKEKGKEFYTIQTKNEKVLYLIIDRDGEEEEVYFLTEISENDLLNTTTDNSETLPKNSAALESAIPVSEGALSNNIENSQKDKADGTTGEDTGEDTTEAQEEKAPDKENSIGTYMMIGIAALAVIGGYYFKVIRKKKEDFLEEDEEDDEEEYEEEEESEDTEDDFFEDTEESEDY